MRFYRVEPFGPRQEEVRAGAMVAKLHNVNAKESQRIGLGDTFPSLKEERPAPSLEAQKAAARARSVISQRLQRG